MEMPQQEQQRRLQFQGNQADEENISYTALASYDRFVCKRFLSLIHRAMAPLRRTLSPCAIICPLLSSSSLFLFYARTQHHTHLSAFKISLPLWLFSFLLRAH